MRWYQRFFRRELTEKRLDVELRFHIEHLIADLVGAGMAPEEARRRARLEFGGLDQVKEECRDIGCSHIIETLVQDLRYGLRQLRRNPGFTVVAVLTLALGIGANTAIFSVVNAVLLQPLPYRNPTRLVKIAETVQNRGAENPITVSAPDFVDWRDSNHSFEDMAAIMPGNFDIAAADLPGKIHGAYATPNFFAMLGVKPLLGRLFLPDEGEMGRNFVLILSYSVWQQRFGSDPNIIGKGVSQNGQNYRVIGVLPQSFVFTWGYFGRNTQRFEIWAPLLIAPDMLGDREFHPFLVVARLKPNVGLWQARSEMSAIAQHVAQQYPATNRSMGVQVISLQDQVVHSIRPALLILLGAVVLVLLIACVNIANLLFGRSIQRSKEMSVRMAIGASRLRLFRQLLTESLLLAGLGGCLGFLLGVWGTHLLVSIIPPDVPRIATVAMDRSVVMFTVAITLLTAIIFGLSPALASSKVELTAYLKEGFGTLASGAGSRMARRILVVSEMALALVLLLGAGLLIKSFWHLLNSDLGFSPNNLLTMKLNPTGAKDSTPAQMRVFASQILNQVNNLPGIQDAAITSRLPLSGGMTVRASYALGANSIALGEQGPQGDYSEVTDDYFRAMGIPVLRGRGFSTQDRANSPPVVIINSVMARQLWPNKDPIGKQLTVSSLEGEAIRTVVGLVGPIRGQSLEEAPGAQIYAPYSQDPSDSLYVVIRTTSNPENIARAVRKRIFKLDRNVPVEDMMTMEQVLAGPTVLPRFYTSVLGLFAALALILAAVGIYGVMSHVVAQQTHEIGVRMALGADRRDVMRLILGKGFKLTFAGVCIGIAGALCLTRFLSSLLYGIKPTDPLTFIAVSLILMGVALLACYIPARRATKVDPMVALRYE
jgi:putative ABC transport system permease protein